MAGGIGGTITLVAYGYWLREKGWSSPAWMRVMRIDNTMAYVVTGIFVISMFIVGATVVAEAGITLSGDSKGLLQLTDVLKDKYGDVIGVAFLIGFFAASFSSLIGVWNGVSLMFADFWGNVRGKGPDHPDSRENGRYFRFYLLWLTFPPMLLLLIGKPIALVIAYGVLGALFLPFLAITLLPLLNTDRVPKQWRNRWYLNVVLVATALLFICLAIYKLADIIMGFFA